MAAVDLPEDLLQRKEIAGLVSGHQAQTSDRFHADLYRRILQNRHKGQGIIEVGCFSGGSTIVLGHLCEQLGWPFHVLDINQAYIDLTKTVLDRVGDRSAPIFFAGTLEKFAQVHRLDYRINTIFIDANHDYEFVRKDIRSIYGLNRRPHFAAFHDYSLRTSNPAHGNIHVDRAIHDSWGERLPLERIGIQFGPDPVPSRHRPSPSGSYWEANGSEAVMIALADVGLPADLGLLRRLRIMANWRDKIVGR
jgi:hypothetical protein